MDCRQIWMASVLCWLIGCGGFIDMLTGWLFKLECCLRCLAGIVFWLLKLAKLAVYAGWPCCLCWLGILPLLCRFAG
jgi:hypothetical protein